MRLTINDAEFANRIIGDESVYPYITDDYTNPELRYCSGALLLSNQGLYLLSPNEHTIFMQIPRTNTIFEVHTMILPEGRGRMAVEAGRDAALWMFENTTCEKLISEIPIDNRRALSYSLRVGFAVEGVCTKSIKRNGILLDQVMVGLEKGKFCQQ